jgi:hypothetical protein
MVRAMYHMHALHAARPVIKLWLRPQGPPGESRLSIDFYGGDKIDMKVRIVGNVYAVSTLPGSFIIEGVSALVGLVIEACLTPLCISGGSTVLIAEY